MEHLESHAEPPRRTFLKWVVHGISAVFTVVLGAPVVAYLIDPLNRPKSASGFRTVDGIRLSDLKIGEPQQGVIRNVRRDAWTLYPNDVVGRVWIVKNTELNKEELKEFSRKMEEVEKKIVEAEKLLDATERQTKLKELEEEAARLDQTAQVKLGVFTTVCPHLGCSINYTPPSQFTCPCHGAKFDMKGAMLEKEHNPAPRGMDTLKWIVLQEDPEVIQVKYMNFQQTKAEKIPKT